MRGLTNLKKLIFDHFDGEEIKSLSFDLGIRHDDLPGDRVSRKVESLLLEVHKQKKLGMLHGELEKQRPRVSWPSLETLERYNWVAVVGGWKTGWDGRAPYMGLSAFQEKDAELFFGREKLVEELLIRVEQSNFVAITGPSGSGKSSVARAGLLPALRDGRIEGSDNWKIEAMSPKGNPLGELLKLVGRVTKSTDAKNHLRKNINQSKLLKETLEIYLDEDESQKCLIFIDQFEELFTQTKKNKLQKHFIDILKAAVSGDSRIKIVIAIRSDFVSNLIKFEGLRILANNQMQLVGAMTAAELTRAITRPALEVGVEIDPALVEKIILDMKGAPDALPLMSFALLDSFESQRGIVGDAIDLNLEKYLDRGGIEEAIERHASRVFKTLSNDEKSFAKIIFAKLIEVGQGRADTSRTARVSELLPVGEDEEFIERLILKLSNEKARLISTTEEKERKVTLAHEKLIDAWPWLKSLIDEQRDIISLANQITSSAQVWEVEKNEDDLFRGARLYQIEENLDILITYLDKSSMGFVHASQEHQLNQIEEKNRAYQRDIATRRRQRLTYFLVFLLIVIIFIGSISLLYTSWQSRCLPNCSNEDLTNVNLRNMPRGLLPFAPITFEDSTLDGLDFSGDYFENINFAGASLKSVNFSNADLRNTDLRIVSAEGASFRMTILDGANFSSSNLQDTIFHSASLIGADLSNANLSGADLTNANLSGASLFGANLTLADLTDTNLTDANLSASNLTGTIFNNTQFYKTEFTHVSLRAVNFDDDTLSTIRPNWKLVWQLMNGYSFADLSGVFLANANLQGVEASNIIFTGVNFRSSDLSNANLSSSDLEGANFANTNLTSADLSNSNLRNAFFDGAILIDVNLNDTNFGYARIAGIEITGCALNNVEFNSDLMLENIKISNSSLRNSNLSNVSFRNVQILNSDLSRVDLSESEMKFVDLTGSNLQAANLSGVDLEGANLQRVNLDGANLQGSNLFDADLRGVDLNFVDFQGARVNEGTKIDEQYRLYFDLKVNGATNRSLMGINWGKLNLSNMDFSNSDLSEGIFDGNNLQEVQFENANLSNAKFNNVDLSDSNFRGAILSSTVFSTTNLSNANMSETDLRNTFFISNAYLNNLTNLNLSNANLQYKDLSGIEFDILNLTGADLRNAKLTGSNLEKLTLIDADLRGADFSQVDFAQLDFNSFQQIDKKWLLIWEIQNKGIEGLDLREVDLSGAYLKDVSFRNADLFGVNFSGSNLINIDFSNANLQNGDLSFVQIQSNPPLTGASFEFADLRGVNLSGSTLIKVNLSNSNLQNSNLNLSLIQGADFRGAKLNDSSVEHAVIGYSDLDQADFSNVDLRQSFLLGNLGKIITNNSTELPSYWLPNN